MSEEGLVPNEIKIGPAALMRQATDIAGVSREIVIKTAMTIGGRRYVRVEGWQAIAVAHGCTLTIRNVQSVEGGISAICDVLKVSEGQIIASAEGFVGDDEQTWSKRPLYARRAMAQTRAMSRAARSAFAYVVVLIDANLSTTPAEEIPIEAEQEPEEPKTKPKPATPKAICDAAETLLSKGTTSDIVAGHQNWKTWAKDRVPEPDWSIINDKFEKSLAGVI